MNKLTMFDIITASNRYPERESHDELTEEIEKNAQIMANKVNAYLDDLGYKGKKSVTSGWRPSDVNDKTANAAKGTSHHLMANAVDLEDNATQDLALLAESRPELLEKHGLYMEDHRNTRGKNTNWFHIQRFPPKSGKRVFLAKAIV